MSTQKMLSLQKVTAKAYFRCNNKAWILKSESETLQLRILLPFLCFKRHTGIRDSVKTSNAVEEILIYQMS